MSKRIPILIGFILLFIAIWLQITSIGNIHHFIERLELLAYDIQLRTRIFTHHPLFQSSVVIVDIDDKSLSKEGRWPWPRAKLGALISELQGTGATVVAIDMLFSEKEDNIVEIVSNQLKNINIDTTEIETQLNKIKPFFDNDSKFAEDLKKGDTVVGFSFLPRTLIVGQLTAPTLVLTTPEEKNLGIIKTDGFISAIPELQSAAKYSGFINVFPDDDGIIRRVPLLLRYQDSVYSSLALEAVRLYLLSTINLITAKYGDNLQLEGIQIANHTIPVDAHAQVIIPFRGKSFTFPYFSATDVLNKKIPADALQGKIVFIGTSATGLGDLTSTAIQSPFPGVEIQATIADGILADTFPFKPAWSLGAELSLTLVLGSLVAFIFPYLGPRILTLLIIFIPILLLLADNWLWEETGLMISILIPEAFTFILGIVNIAYGYLFESRRREHLKEMFGQYVPAKHIDEMLQETGSYGLHGEERDMTVLFADIRHFTTISERLSASQLKELLSEFFTPMTEIIFKYRGTIDKYVGDMIMAFWGAPLKDKRHAQHAIAAALEMHQTIQQLQPKLKARGWPNIRIGIGLNSGMMSVGDMGSKFHRNYTVLGDAVNLASRSESLTKFYHVPIIVTEHTHRDQRNYVFRLLDRVRVKGKKTGTALYEVVCRRGEANPQKLKEIELSQEATNYYFNQEWDKALTLFSQLSSLHPQVKLYSLYLNRIDAFKRNPPPSDWDGIFKHISK